MGGWFLLYQYSSICWVILAHTHGTSQAWIAMWTYHPLFRNHLALPQDRDHTPWIMPMFARGKCCHTFHKPMELSEFQIFNCRSFRFLRKMDDQASSSPPVLELELLCGITWEPSSAWPSLPSSPCSGWQRLTASAWRWSTKIWEAPNSQGLNQNIPINLVHSYCMT